MGLVIKKLEHAGLKRCSLFDISSKLGSLGNELGNFGNGFIDSYSVLKNVSLKLLLPDVLADQRYLTETVRHLKAGHFDLLST